MLAPHVYDRALVRVRAHAGINLATADIVVLCTITCVRLRSRFCALTRRYQPCTCRHRGALHHHLRVTALLFLCSHTQVSTLPLPGIVVLCTITCVRLRSCSCAPTRRYQSTLPLPTSWCFAPSLACDCALVFALPHAGINLATADIVVLCTITCA